MPAKKTSTPPGRKATLKDVARHCDVSTMTVSRVLNDKGRVSPAMASRIRKAIRDLGYTPNMVAKSLRDNKTRTFGMVVSDCSELLVAKMTRGVLDAATAEDYSVIMANTHLRGDLERKSITMLLDKRIDGLILGAPFTLRPEQMEEIRAHGIPVVMLLRASDLPVDYVAGDNHGGGRLAVEYLAGRGVREIHFLNLPRRHSGGEERRAGNRQAMRDHGLSYDEGLFVEPDIELAREATHAILRRGVSPGGAVVCGCDVIAMGALRACFERGARVPEDVRIVGYDDIEMADHLRVPLTTIRQPVYEMGRQGVELLLRRRDNPSAERVKRRLPVELIVRRSA